MKPFMTREAATEQIRDRGIPCGHRQLADLASRRKGPRFTVINGRALYRPEDVDAWIDQQATAGSRDAAAEA